MSSLLERRHPSAQFMIVAIHVLQARSRAMDEQHAHISVAPLADAQELGLAAGAVLPRHESNFRISPEISRELNRRKVPPLRGGKHWYPITAGRLLLRLERTGLIRIRRPASRESLLNLALSN